MNTTVARIVEIMFQDTVMNDEVQALKDEVMNNCQERYQDMLARGMQEDEAIAAVIDSLKGMEEVIAEYPRKVEAPAFEEDDEPEKDLVFDPKQVKRVKVILTSDDICVESSCDDLIHVCYDVEDMPNLVVNAAGDTLQIQRDNKVEVKTPEMPEKKEWNSFSGIMNNIGRMLGNIKVNVQYGGGGEVTIALPDEYAFALELHSTSGDVSIDNVNVNDIFVGTTSGDVEINLDKDIVPEKIYVKGASGDACINANARNLHAHTVSGDVECNGEYEGVFVNTVSGDGEVNGMIQEAKLNSVSGDMELYVKSDALRKVQCNTTSGDLTIHLPALLQGQVAVQMNTTSGDRNNRFGEPVGAPLAFVQANSVSGDVTVC